MRLFTQYKISNARPYQPVWKLQSLRTFVHTAAGGSSRFVKTYDSPGIWVIRAWHSSTLVDSIVLSGLSTGGCYPYKRKNVRD